MMLTLSYPTEPIYWDLADTIPIIISIQTCKMKEHKFGKGRLTLNIRNALLEDLLENLGVLKLLVDLADNGVGKLNLLALANLALVAHPRVENLLGLSSNGGALLELVSLRLELGGFLNWKERKTSANPNVMSIQENCIIYPGDSEELLGNVNDTGELVDVVNALLDGVGVVGTGSVQDVLVLLDLALSPFPVGGTTVLADGSEDAEKTEGGNSFLVKDVQLIADGGNGKTGSGREDGGLGDQSVTRQRVEDRLGLLLGVLGRDVGVETGGREVGSDGTDVARGKGRPQPGST